MDQVESYNNAYSTTSFALKQHPKKYPCTNLSTKPTAEKGFSAGSFFVHICS